MTSKADIYALSVLDGQKDDYKLSEYNWNTIFNVSPTGTIERLIKNDLLCLTDSPELTLPKLLVPELKEILKNNGQKTSGKKADLINRILNNVNIETMKENINFQVFALTSTGKDLLQNNASIVVIAKYFDNEYITFKNAEIVGVKPNEADPKKIITKITDYFYDLYFSKGYWDKVESVLICKENRERDFNSIDEKLDTYLQSIYLSLAGQNMNFDHESPTEIYGYLDSADSLKNYACEIQKYYIESIQKIEAGTEITNNDILERFKLIEKKFESVESIFNNSEMNDLLLFSLEGNSENKINAIYMNEFKRIKAIKQTNSTGDSNLISIDTNAILNAEVNKINNKLIEKKMAESKSNISNKEKHQSIWDKLSTIFKN
ncbi:SAP domain-containing protein [Companilactobacillus paralimentarius]|uniref:SAP domain-containing protein n=1 Tax=Companilactobacillus paralimentarius TaxID=83526 RepID=UPI0037DFCD63